jgi:hypothetical protein
MLTLTSVMTAIAADFYDVLVGRVFTMITAVFGIIIHCARATLVSALIIV